MSGQITFANPMSDYRMAYGPVLLWRFPLTGELPVIGVPWEVGPKDGFTHWTPIPVPSLVPTR